MPKTIPDKRYDVAASLDNVTLAKPSSAIRLEVFKHREKLGELQIRRGSIFWWGAKHQKPKRLRWDRVADAFNELAYPNEKL